jgi:diacylglycerol kinase (ATP)
MKTKVILNPYANRWRAKERIPEVHAALKAAGIDYELAVTERPRQAIDLAAEAAKQGFEAIIAAGGDGTISEVVNGMARTTLTSADSRIEIPLGVLPLGSANDFSVNLGLPLDLPAAAAGFLAGKQRLIDLGQVSYRIPGSEAAQPNPICYFDNNSAIGLEPTITLIQQRITWLHGTPRYLLATLIGIFQHPHWNAELEWEGGSYKGPITLVTIGNNPLTGGLFYMTPHADPADGRLTFVHAYMSTRLKVLNLLPRTMKPGVESYVEHPAVHEVHSTWLRIRSEQPTPLHADGEIQHGAVQEIEYRILPGKLGVLTV